MAGEDLEQIQLPPRRVGLAPAARRDVPARVDDEVADDAGPAAVAAAPAQQRVQPRGELVERERLDEVGVGAGPPARPPVGARPPGGAPLSPPKTLHRGTGPPPARMPRPPRPPARPASVPAGT